MDKENKNNPSSRDDEPFPPEIKGLKKFFLGVADVIMAISVIFIILLCLNYFKILQNWPFCPTCWPYIPFFLFLFGLILDRYLRHKRNVHKARLADHSEVIATIVEARTVEPRLNAPEKRPEEYETKKANLLTEVDRLEGHGSNWWTEYQVLSLDQMLVDFLKVDDLKARSQSSLADLQEYSGDDAVKYDYDQFKIRSDQIVIATRKIEKKEDEEKNDLEIDKAADSLRAELRTLFEHVSDYERRWAEGSVIIRDLIICCVAAVIIFIIMGILPFFLFPQEKISLNLLNWGFLGSGGSLTAVLLALWRSNFVEVGNTQGKVERWRAIIGAVLGFVAGIIILSIIKGELLTGGGAVPELKGPIAMGSRDFYLSILWAVAAGMGFEKIFDRMKKSVEGTT